MQFYRQQLDFFFCALFAVDMTFSASVSPIALVFQSFVD